LNFIVFDLEATCWEEKRHNHIQEIIEIGALKMDRFGEVLGRFERFVKPVFFPTLSPFCKQLTSITQNDVESADEFVPVIEDFLDWIGHYDDEEYLLCSWGFYDRKQLIHDCELHKLEGDWANQHISLKHQYNEYKRNRKPIGLNKAVRQEGFEFTGTHHRGIDDAINLAKIFVKYKDIWQF